MAFELFKNVCRNSLPLRERLRKFTSGLQQRDVVELGQGDFQALQRVIDTYPRETLVFRLLVESGDEEFKLFWNRATADAQSLCYIVTPHGMMMNPKCMPVLLSGRPTKSAFIDDDHSLVPSEVELLNKVLKRLQLTTQDIEGLLTYCEYLYKRYLLSCLFAPAEKAKVLSDKCETFTLTIANMLLYKTVGAQKVKVISFLEKMVFLPFVTNKTNQIPATEFNVISVIKYAHALVDTDKGDQALSVLERLNTLVGDSPLRVLPFYHHSSFLIKRNNRADFWKARLRLRESLEVAEKDKTKLVPIESILSSLLTLDLSDNRFVFASDHLERWMSETSANSYKHWAKLPLVLESSKDRNCPPDFLKKAKLLLGTQINVVNRSIRNGADMNPVRVAYTQNKAEIDHLMEGNEDACQTLKTWGGGLYDEQYDFFNAPFKGQVLITGKWKEGNIFGVELEDKILFGIFFLCDTKSLISAMSVCRQWRNFMRGVMANVHTRFMSGQAVPLPSLLANANLFPNIFKRLNTIVSTNPVSEENRQLVNSACDLVASNPVYHKVFCKLVSYAGSTREISEPLLEMISRKSLAIRKKLASLVTGGTGNYFFYLPKSEAEELFNGGVFASESFAEKYPRDMFILNLLAKTGDVIARTLLEGIHKPMDQDSDNDTN